MNFANGLIQWGQATGNTAVRDAGIFMWTTQAAAIQQYWFDVDNTNFPANWHNYAAIVWGSGAAYATWFSGEDEMIYGINMLPATGGHLYMGAYPAKVKSAYQEMVSENGGNPSLWRDILWQFQALGDPDAALANFRADPNYAVEEGESRAHTFHWLRNLAALGTADAGVTANHPLARVFTKNGAKTYVASNITNSALTVTYSDGKTVSVPAGKTVATGAQNWSGGNANGGGTVSPAPTSASPTPSKTSVSPTPSKTSVSPTPSKTSVSPTPSKTSASPSPTNNPGTAWVAYKAYATGSVVTYNGASYRCLQAHTSLPGWEPANVPALWQRI
jgi:hypothetical protein